MVALYEGAVLITAEFRELYFVLLFLIVSKIELHLLFITL